jgi:hypothetical protein
MRHRRGRRPSNSDESVQQGQDHVQDLLASVTGPDARAQTAETEERLLGRRRRSPPPTARSGPIPRGAPHPAAPLGRLSTGQQQSPQQDAVVTDLSPLAPERCPPHVGMAALRQDPGRPEAETCPPPVGKTWRATREGTSGAIPRRGQRGTHRRGPRPRPQWRAPLGPRRRRHPGRPLGQRPPGAGDHPCPRLVATLLSNDDRRT